MIEHDYSQLPVVDAADRPLGMVSSDSILRALHYFHNTLQSLRVSHALIKVHTYHPQDDLFELLDDLRDSYAVLIVDSDDTLVGIVTSYDATEYFRRRSEDVMLVEDVETMIRDYILAAFTSPTGELKQDELDAIVAETLSEHKDVRNRFAKALT
jgi:CBS domain-containing protein